MVSNYDYLQYEMYGYHGWFDTPVLQCPICGEEDYIYIEEYDYVYSYDGKNWVCYVVHYAVCLTCGYEGTLDHRQTTVPIVTEWVVPIEGETYWEPMETGGPPP